MNGKSRAVNEVIARVFLAACVVASVIANGQGLAASSPPAVESRFKVAKAIAAQQWYSENAALLDDVLWQPDGSLIFRDRAQAEYRKLDARSWRFESLVGFAKLDRMLRAADGIDPQKVGEAVRSPVSFQRSGVLVKIGTDYFSCGFSAARCDRYSPTLMDRGEVNRSPDGGAGLILGNRELFLVSATLPDGVRLTQDGSDLIVYGSKNRALPRTGESFAQPKAIWSTDGRYALVSRIDQSHVPVSSVIDWLPQAKLGTRPKHFTVRDTYFGDAQAGERALCLVDVAARRITLVPDTAAVDFTSDPVAAGFIQFSDDGRHAYYIRESDDFRSAQLIELDLRTLSLRTVLTERSPDGGFLYFSGQRNPAAFHVFPKRNALVWYSERDGFGHLYLHDLRSGRLIRPLTQGPWTFLSIVRVSHDRIYFLATNPESAAEPYNQQLLSIDIDTGRIRQHTDSGMDHAFSWPPEQDLYVQSSASIDSPATLTLRGVGREARREPLSFGVPPGQALSEITKTGFKKPIRFRIVSKIEDRAVLGTMYAPSWAADQQKLPVIEKIYPGYCCVPAPWSFPHQRGGRFSIPRSFEPQALAELGFVVVITAGPGSPLRGRAYHQAQQGEGYWDADSLETHIDVLKQLAEAHPEMDLSRVGIYGHSGGGYAAARAILKYPEFYQVAVALSGNHDRRLYGASWPIMYAGHDPRAADALEGPETATLAGNLRGHLLLMHGDVDSDVLIDSTMQLAGALQRAGKKFDMQVIIGGPHGIDSNAFAQEYYWSYFLEHLRGEKIRVDFNSY